MANLGLGVCGKRIQLRVVGEVGGVAHTGSEYTTIVVKSIGRRRRAGIGVASCVTLALTGVSRAEQDCAICQLHRELSTGWRDGGAS